MRNKVIVVYGWKFTDIVDYTEYASYSGLHRNTIFSTLTGESLDRYIYEGSDSGKNAVFAIPSGKRFRLGVMKITDIKECMNQEDFYLLEELAKKIGLFLPSDYDGLFDDDSKRVCGPPSIFLVQI